MKYLFHSSLILTVIINCLAFSTHAQPPLEFERRVIKINNTQVDVELADTSIEIEMGLMLRDSAIPGMLLNYQTPRNIQLWMKNMMIPVDVAIIDESGTIVEFMSMKAFDEEIKTSSIEGVSALELPKGWFKEHQVNLGDQVSFIKPEAP